ncbi:MAG: 4-hydroxy-tetrahydrodipicolinate synthase [Acidimicrobiales bacterium]
MPRTGRFGPVGCAMVTPFDSEGNLDLDASVTLARWLCEHGNDFLVLSGTTGESPVLSDAEKADLWRAVAEAVTVPVVAGTSTSDTAHSVELTRAAQSAGAAGILAVTPYYSRPSQSGIESHMRAVSYAAGGLPVILYDIPVRTGRKVAHDVIVRLAREGVIAGVKDATANPAGTAALIAEAPAGMDLYSGNDGDTLALLAVGAVGVVSVESHWAGDEVGEMIAAFVKGDVDHAREVNARLIASHQFQSGDDAPNPVPAKAMMRALGLPVGECRLPLGPAPEGLEDRARRVFDQLHG